MDTELTRARREANLTRYHPGQRGGHYESFFVRANHPRRPLAFWIRYTIFSPEGRPEDAMGELWAVYFDGEAGRQVAVKKVVPFMRCSFSSTAFLVRIDDARLEPTIVAGSAATGAHEIAWDLTYSGAEPPLFLFPLTLYRRRLPKAKSLVGLPLARFAGALRVDGETVDVIGWQGSQNHNWGSRHTDHYAWGQVAGFDTHPDSFLEVATARLRIGPLWTPFMTVLVLRHRGEEIALNTLRQATRAHGSFSYFIWHFGAEGDGRRVAGTIAAARDTFVGLRYGNPPGGIKDCLNSKLASCELHLTDARAGGAAGGEQLSTRHRAAFEIVTDDRDHGVAMRV
jgi:hypothetical protein